LSLFSRAPQPARALRRVSRPLLAARANSMSNSVLLCISTLLESGNHYSKMFDLVDSVGRKLFESISITLVCKDCMETEHPERCTHKLAECARPRLRPRLRVP
jgi:hypothetical protein